MFAKGIYIPQKCVLFKNSVETITTCMYVYYVIYGILQKRVHFQWQKWKCHYIHCLIENDVEINSEQCSFRLLFFKNIDLFL